MLVKICESYFHMSSICHIDSSYFIMLDNHLNHNIINHRIISGWWLQPLWKICSSVGMMTFSILMEKNTNQIHYIILHYITNMWSFSVNLPLGKAMPATCWSCAIGREVPRWRPSHPWSRWPTAVCGRDLFPVGWTIALVSPTSMVRQHLNLHRVDSAVWLTKRYIVHKQIEFQCWKSWMKWSLAVRLWGSHESCALNTDRREGDWTFVAFQTSSTAQNTTRDTRWLLRDWAEIFRLWAAPGLCNQQMPRPANKHHERTPETTPCHQDEYELIKLINWFKQTLVTKCDKDSVPDSFGVSLELGVTCVSGAATQLKASTFCKSLICTPGCREGCHALQRLYQIWCFNLFQHQISWTSEPATSALPGQCHASANLFHTFEIVSWNGIPAIQWIITWEQAEADER